MEQRPTSIKKFFSAARNLIPAVTIAGGIICLCLLILPLKAYGIGVGDVAPDFKITTVDGKEISGGGSVKIGKPVYLVFWTTW